ncbi:hypothetical protein DNAM_390 [Pseudomonas phage BroderSalsa]|nr:hypothetical protein DNAM_390 [Pseudomonas phage BroderSalsa]
MDLINLKESIKKANEGVQALVGEAIAFSTDKSNDFEDRLQVALELEGSYPEEGYYNGNVLDEHISLYDDLNWERHETKYLSDLVDHALDQLYDEAVKEDPEELLSFSDETESLKARIEGSDLPVCQVIRDFLDSGIGSGTFDW